MSCFIVSTQSVIDLAYFINQICHSEYYFVNPNDVRSVFANKYGFDTTKEIAKKLYDLNVLAIEERYKESCSDFETFINGAEPKISYILEFGIKDWCYILKKMQCYLYQCTDGDCDKSPIYLALYNMKNELSTFICSELQEYKDVEWN